MRNLKRKFNKKLTILTLLIIGFIGIVTADAIYENGVKATIEKISGAGAAGGLTIASMAAVGSLKRVTDKDTAGNSIIARVWLIALDQIDEDVAFPVANSSGEIGTIPLKTGEYMHYFDCIDNSLEDKSSGAKGDVTTAVTNTFSFIIGGLRQKLLEFLEGHAGDRFIIIYQMEDRSYRLLGNDLKPMLLKSFERTNGKDSRSTTLTFENTSFEQPKIYVGSIVKIDPVQLAADAVSIAFTRADEYKTGANTVASAIASFTGLSTSDIGRHVEIIGTGGSHPTTIAETAGFVLVDGTTWTGNSGSRIIFKVLDINTLVEISRVQTAA